MSGSAAPLETGDQVASIVAALVAVVALVLTVRSMRKPLSGMRRRWAGFGVAAVVVGALFGLWLLTVPGPLRLAAGWAALLALLIGTVMAARRLRRPGVELSGVLRERRGLRPAGGVRSAYTGRRRRR